LRDAAIKHTDPETVGRIFFDAGFNAGKAVYENLIGKVSGLDAFAARLQQLLRDLKVGILRFEEADTENLRFVLTVSEDLDCSGLPMMEEAICTFDEGLIAGLLESFTGTPFHVKEVDCWCTGGRTCRFEAHPVHARRGGRDQALAKEACSSR
jgi:predicted hydrocarbon binding protein